MLDNIEPEKLWRIAVQKRRTSEQHEQNSIESHKSSCHVQCLLPAVINDV